MNVNLGEIHVLDPREIWENEERDFTPWLADNISGISESVGFPIEIEQTEKLVGKYRLDILGKVEGTDKTVVIENQLDGSDHKHLGQLITYAAGLDASIIIWVCPSIRNEHKVAIEWMNEISDSSKAIFLLRPEVIKIDESKPAIRFILESGPSEFVREIREAASGKDTVGSHFNRLIWEDLYEYLAKNGDPSTSNRRTSADSWVTFSVGKSGISINVCIARGSRFRIELSMNSSSAEDNTKRYNSLSENKSTIESMIADEDVHFEPMEGSKSSRISLYREYDKSQILENIDYKNEMFNWINNGINNLRVIAQEYLIKSER